MSTPDKLRKLSLIIASIDDLIFEVDSDGVFIDFMQPPQAALYAPPEVFLGKHITDVLPPNVAEAMVGMMSEVEVGGATPETATGSQSAKAQPSPGAVMSTQVS